MITYNGITVDRIRRTIEHRGKKRYFKPNNRKNGYNRTMFDIWCYLILGGGNTQEMFEALYGDREDGGPECGHKELDVRLCQIKHDFKHLDLKLVKERRASRTYRKLVPIDVV